VQILHSTRNVERHVHHNIANITTIINIIITIVVINSIAAAATTTITCLLSTSILKVTPQRSSHNVLCHDAAHPRLLESSHKLPNTTTIPGFHFHEIFSRGQRAFQSFTKAKRSYHLSKPGNFLIFFFYLNHCLVIRCGNNTPLVNTTPETAASLLKTIL
jgi:hypothetical protein